MLIPLPQFEVTASSLYLQCQDILGKLCRVATWKARYYDVLVDVWWTRAGKAAPCPTELLWALFRQGGTLCCLANLLLPGAITQVHELAASDGPSSMARRKPP